MGSMPNAKILEWEVRLVDVLTHHPELQTWNEHLDIRLPEIRFLAEHADLTGVRDLLEIGCGNGIGSAYFAGLVDRVVASDLAQVQHASHAIGLGKTRRLVDALDLKNVEVVGCSAQDMPFADGSFDAVLAMHTLEHLPDLPKGLSECLRVLRPGGRFIVSVPAAASSVFYPLAFYNELGGRVYNRFVKRKLSRFVRARQPGKPARRHRASDRAAEEGQPVVHDWRSFRKAYRHFPLPSPHGEFPSWWSELWGGRPSRWVEALRDAGFESVEPLAMSVIPRNLLSATLGRVGTRIFHGLDGLDRRLCQSAPSALHPESLHARQQRPLRPAPAGSRSGSFLPEVFPAASCAHRMKHPCKPV